MKVKLEEGVWLADGEGDPARTLVEDNAKEFDNAIEAYDALKAAREYHAFTDAELTDDFL
jgi:hypothetical protein